MVTTVSRAWARSGDHRVLEQAHADTVAELQQLGGSGIYPVSEGAINSMRAEIKRLTKPAPYDAALAGASRELSSAVHRYWRACSDIVDRQKKLGRLRETTEHVLLRDISSEMLQPPLEPQRMIDALFGSQRKGSADQWGVKAPEFDSVLQYHAATQAVTAHALGLEATLERLNAVFHFEVVSKEEQNRRLIIASAERTAERIRVLEDRIAELEHPTHKKGKRR